MKLKKLLAMGMIFMLLLSAVVSIYGEEVVTSLREVQCDSLESLQAALSDAKPGDHIILNEGVYKATSSQIIGSKGAYFYVGADGTADMPIIIESSNESQKQVLEGVNVKDPAYGLYITGDYVQVKNIVIKTAAKGIVLDHADNVVLEGVEVSNVGAEGIHVRDGSQTTMISGAKVTNTGRVDKGFGEGIYIGSDRSAWIENGGEYDPSVSNVSIKSSQIGPGVTAEPFDIKEGSKNTLVEGNTLIGKDISGELFADSFIDVKGINVTVKDNVCWKNYNAMITKDFAEVNRTSENPLVLAQETSNGDIGDTTDGNIYINNTINEGNEDGSVPEEVVEEAEVDTDEEGVIKLNPLADAYTKSSAADVLKNESKIQIKQTNSFEEYSIASDEEKSEMDIRVGYLKFATSSIEGKSIETATLRLYAQKAFGAEVSVLTTKDHSNNWSEKNGDAEPALTFNDRPELGNIIATTTITNGDQYFEWDVTEYISDRIIAGEDVTLILADLGISGKYSAFYDMKYGNNVPELVIVEDVKVKTEPKKLTRYTITSGDMLFKIARKFNTTWEVLFEMNKDVIKNPHLIYPGQVIVVQEGNSQ